MSHKARLTQLEKRTKPQSKMTWKDFINVANIDGENFDPATRAAWLEFIADEEAADEPTQPINPA